MKVNFKKEISNAKTPEYATVGAAGADITAASVKRIKGGLLPLYEYDTGISVAIPIGYYGMLVPRSSVSKLLMWLANSVGIIDSDYRGTIRARYRSILGLGKYKVGDRVGQIVLMKRNKFDFIQVDTHDTTVRGEGGFGSTGK